MSAPTNIVRNSGETLSFDYDGIPYTLPGHGDTTIVPADVATHVSRTYAAWPCQIVHPDAEAKLRAGAPSKRRSAGEDAPPAALAPAPAPAPEPPAAPPVPELAAPVPLAPAGAPAEEPKGGTDTAPEPPAAAKAPKKKAAAKRGAKKGK